MQPDSTRVVDRGFAGPETPPAWGPAVIPSIIGPIIAMSGAMKPSGSEASGAVGEAGGVSELASRSKSGRHASSVVAAH